MTYQVNPRDVLKELNRMGFCNVTTKQLREFILDLKKLMKYDVNQCSCPPNVCESGLFINHCPPCQFLHRNRPCISRKEEKCAAPDNTEQHELTDETSNAPEGPTRPNASRKNGHVNESKPDSVKGPRKKSAFIKPWRLQVPVSTYRRSDPVTLYHHYQSLWRQQKVPGDDAHEDIRWNVREKMLGADPHPWPVSRCTSVERMSRPYKGDTYNSVLKSIPKR